MMNTTFKSTKIEYDFTEDTNSDAAFLMKRAAIEERLVVEDDGDVLWAKPAAKPAKPATKRYGSGRY